MISIVDLYSQCRRKIGYELGYVSQQVAGEWAAKQAETIAGEIASHRRDVIERNIAQLYVNSLCLAHEYYISLGKVYSSAGVPEQIKECVSDSVELPNADLATTLQESVRNLYNRVAFYHGWPEAQTDRTLSHHILDVHKTLYSIAKIRKIDLERVLPGFISSVRSQSISRRLRYPFGPVVSPIIDTFRKIRDDSVCIYARNANTWGAAPPPSDSDLQNQCHLDKYLGENIDILARLSRTTRHEDVDAFLIMLPEEFGSSVQALGKTVRDVLSFYSANDPLDLNCMQRIGDAKWRYVFGGMSYFVQSFGTCYNADNTRYTFGVKNTFIQFVSEAAFHRAVPRPKWQQAREAIRTKARDTGQPYDVHDHEADTFVHNSRSGMPPIQWYKMVGDDVAHPRTQQVATRETSKRRRQ